MCGFAGIIDLEGLAGSPAERLVHLRAMGRQLSRRGPDDEQFYDDGLLSLVFRRLSIIDLAGGRQPMWNESGTVLAAVNGEIYNHHAIRHRLEPRHVFASRSDSEVVLHLYEELGIGLLPELNGMFALLVWDTSARRLLLARDRLGIKPLFHARAGGALLFGSELKALLAHPACPRELNWRDVQVGTITSHAIPTFVHGIQHLPGGHSLVLEPGRDEGPCAWWRLSDHFPGQAGAQATSAEQYVERYGELLHESVQMQLMSDVPVGLFLSGGIDSSLLAAMAHGGGQELHCFTVAEATTIDAGDVAQAERVTGELGLDYYPVAYDHRSVLDEIDFGLQQLEYLLWAMETPRFSIEWLLKHELHRYAKTRLPGLKVMLLGQGADEFAGGYSRSMGNEATAWSEYLQRLQRVHANERRADAQIPEYMQVALAPGYPPTPAGDVPSEYHRQMLSRIATLQRYNLWHEDRTSASQGVEARVPFLDHRLVELLASVPPGLHASLFFDKRIVREQLARVLPSYPRDKLKVRFYATGRDQSITRLRAGIIRRVFPEFREKYLDQPDAIFSAERLGAGFDQLQQGSNLPREDLDALFDCIAITLFDRMCRTLAERGPPAGVDPPSPLQAWAGPPAARQ